MGHVKNILVTGGAGFIGSCFVRLLLRETECRVLNIDKLTYAGNLLSLENVTAAERYSFQKIDICDLEAIKQAFNSFCPDAIVHLAAESHVDRSIEAPDDFIETNIFGTYRLLQATRQYLENMEPEQKNAFRFLHVSTDEVYGDLPHPDIEDAAQHAFFTEKSPYNPSSPYSASKASSDHLVNAWGRTFELPVLISNCSNNYGPYQYPEKLIPLMILNALAEKPLPVYGTGSQIRDWLFVEDHARALYSVLLNGTVGSCYNIGGHNEKRNIEVVETICTLLDELRPLDKNRRYRDLISFVEDRPGHDMRYAIDASKIESELNWVPKETFESGMRKTVEWYLQNKGWSNAISDGTYRRAGLISKEEGRIL